jgi:hypothetical protein
MADTDISVLANKISVSAISVSAALDVGYIGIRKYRLKYMDIG